MISFGLGKETPYVIDTPDVYQDVCMCLGVCVHVCVCMHVCVCPEHLPNYNSESVSKHQPESVSVGIKL